MDETAPERAIDPASGTFRSVVTCLEMRAPPAAPAPAPPRTDAAIERWMAPAVDDYLELFHRIGDRWLWFARLLQPAAEIERLLAAPDYHAWRLRVGGTVAGLGELNRGRAGEVKLEYLGLVPEWIGRGLGRWFLQCLIEEAWRGDVARVWLHTCTEDHPGALALYRRAGFEPCDRRVEWVPDPRLRGLLPRDAAPHVPLAE